LASISSLMIFNSVPTPDPVEVVTFILDTEAIDGKASPLKPKVLILNKSKEEEILLVAWRLNANKASSRSIPHPSSSTVIFFLPASTIETLICLAPASIEFSTSSFRTLLGLSTTSPAAIILASLVSNT